ncbi:MAG: TolB family protein [Phycisphaerae bacterium]
MASPIRAITRGPRHHFFGYYDMRPWSADGRYHLCLEVGFMDRPPKADDTAAVGVVDLKDGNRFVPLTHTRAWNFQQGAMLHWAPGQPGTVLFNDRRDGRFVCVARGMAGGGQRIIGPAIGDLSDDGRVGATLNFARVAVCRPGYGYAGLDDPFAAREVTDQDGLGILDMATGQHRIVLSFADVARLEAANPRRYEGMMYFNHVLLNPSGTRAAIIVRWKKGDVWWNTQFWTVGTDGSSPRRLLEGPKVSHFDWKDDRTLIAWAGVGGKLAVYEFEDADEPHPRPILADAIRQDGHVAFSPDRRWVCTDTYPDAAGYRGLAVVEYATGRVVELGRYYSPTVPGMAEIRCDFHPSWSDDGRRLAIDGMHEGTRQRYVVELGELT